MLIHLLPALTAGLFLTADAPEQDAKTREEIARLQGTWNIVSLELEGNKFPAEFLKGSKIEIKGNSFVSTAGGAIYKGTLKVDVSKTPRTLDLMFTEGPEKGNTSLAIYEVNGDDCKICLTVTGKERPTQFATKPSSGHAFETLKRQK